MELNWNFQRGRGGLGKKNPFCRGGMDIFWNCTLENNRTRDKCKKKKID